MPRWGGAIYVSENGIKIHLGTESPEKIGFCHFKKDIISQRKVPRTHYAATSELKYREDITYMKVTNASDWPQGKNNF